MKGLLLLNLVVIITVTYCSTTVGAQPDLKPLGSADGKSFFYSRVSRKLDEADYICRVNGMHLASFDTRAQLSLATDSPISDFDQKVYWTSARDSTAASHYNWNDGTGSVVDLFGMELEFPPQYELCLRFEKGLDKRPPFSVVACSGSGVTAGTLCET